MLTRRELFMGLLGAGATASAVDGVQAGEGDRHTVRIVNQFDTSHANLLKFDKQMLNWVRANALSIKQALR